MVILPAIDLKNGVCVRLRQGRADDVTEQTVTAVYDSSNGVFLMRSQ